MSYKNTKTSYGSVIKFLHWLIFLLILCMLIVGFFMHDIESKQLKGFVYMMHKSFGITVLALMLVRAIWAWFNPKPSLPKGTPLWEKVAERMMHFFLYIVVIAMPLVGWGMSMAADKTPSFFGLFNFPLPGIPKSKALAGFFNTTHEVLAWIIIVLVSIHILAALKHYLIDKDDVLQRMMPGK